jgi:hypothetical protein
MNVSEEIQYPIDHKFDFDSVSYVPIKFCKRTGFSRIVYENVEIRWPEEDEIDLIAKWCKRPDIFLAFGFSRPIARNYIKKSILPDLTGTTEHVEFLIINDLLNRKSIGFLIVYEGHKFRDPNQEIDFAITNNKYLGSTALVRNIKICILTYLFAVRGAETVHWIRRKSVENKLPETRLSGRKLGYRKKEKQHLVSLGEFKRLLKHLQKVNKKARTPIVFLNKKLEVIHDQN